MLGIIGLGKMGYNMASRLLLNKKEILVYNRSPEKVDSLAKKGAIPSHTYDEFFSKLKPPRIIWLMVPHEEVEKVLNTISPHLQNGDILIDGGNSNYKDSIIRAETFKAKGIAYLDIGVSGGIAGAETGYCMMVGGEENAYAQVEPYLQAMCIKEGYGHVGKSGAGHFVKMAHNAIEYGMMESIGEGCELVANSEFEVDMAKLTGIWNHGSIIESFLLKMAQNAFHKHGNLEHIQGEVPDSGEGRWAVEEALKQNINFTAITYALMERFRSRKTHTYSDKLLSVIRDEFGGHGYVKK